MIQIVKYNKPRSGSGAVSASGAGIALSSLAGLLTQQQLATILEGYLLKETFDDLFVKESDGHGGYRIKAKYALYSNQYLSCLGNNPDAGTVELGATTLGGLNNVAVAADEVSAAAKVLVREAGASQWTLKNLSDIVGLDTSALSTYLSNNGYAKQSWVEAKGYLTQHQSLAGYALESWVQAQGYLTAITKAQVEAVLTGNITSHTHSQYLTSALASQTYQPIGDYATNTALNSAVTSLNTAIGAKLDAATFDDLFAKESDGKGGYRIKAKYALYSSQYISCLGNNPDAGTTTPSTPGVDLDAVADYLTQQGYATQAWVGQQGYLKAADLSAYALAENAYLKSQQNRKSNAHTVASLTAVANSADSWVNNYSFSLVNNNNALNFYVGGVQNERQALIQSGHSSYGYAQVLGILHLNKLGGAVYINDSLALNAANVGTYAVTLDTAQTITGAKKFTAYETEHGSRVTAMGLFDTFANYPHYMWHVANQNWTKAVMDTNGHLHFIEGGAGSFTGYRQLYASAFVRNGGTSSQFLKADGSVDGNSYLTAHQSLDYIKVLDTRYAETTTSMAQQLTAHFKGNDKIGLADGGIFTGLLHLQPWVDASGGSAHDIAFTVNGNMWLRTGAIGSAWGAWRKVLDTNNYASVLDSRYVNASGDTMTGLLTIATNGEILQLGATNGGWAHYITQSANGHWFNKTIGVQGEIYAGTNYNQRVFHQGFMGSGSGLDADLLDGHHVTSMMTNRGRAISNFLTWDNATGEAEVMYWTPNTSNRPYEYGAALCFRVTGSWHYRLTFDTDNPRVRLYQGINTTALHHCGDLAFTSDNVASATKLQTARSLWGNNFNGTGNVGGGLTFDLLSGTNARNLLYQQMADNDFFRIRCGGTATNAGWVELATADDGTEPIYVRQYTGTFATVTRTLTLLDGNGNTSLPGQINVGGDIISNNGWLYTSGNRGWCNLTYGGGWFQENATWISAYAKPVHIAYTTGEGANSFGVGLRCYSAGHTSVEVQGGSYTMGLGCHSNGSWYWWRGTSSGKGYVMQYDGTTWAFTGVIKTSTGMYSDGYMSCLGQNTGSDMRLKHIIGDVTLSLDMIADAPAKLFRWRYGEFAGRLAVGSIAQYWQQYLEPVVSKRPDDYLQMDYGVTATVAVINLARYTRGIKTEVELLREENQKLKERVAALERRIVA